MAWQNELRDIDGDDYEHVGETFVRESPKAVLLRLPGGDEVWFPKSVLRVDEGGMVYAPGWFIEKNDLRSKI